MTAPVNLWTDEAAVSRLGGQSVAIERPKIIISFHRFPDDESHDSGSKIRKTKKFIGLPLLTNNPPKMVVTFPYSKS